MAYDDPFLQRTGRTFQPRFSGVSTAQTQPMGTTAGIWQTPPTSSVTTAPGDEPAKPAATPATLMGFDASKMLGGHNTPKYSFGRFFQPLGHTPDVVAANWDAFVKSDPRFQGWSFNGKDTISYGGPFGGLNQEFDGIGSFDVINKAGLGGQGLQWNPNGAWATPSVPAADPIAQILASLTQKPQAPAAPDLSWLSAFLQPRQTQAPPPLVFQMPQGSARPPAPSFAGGYVQGPAGGTLPNQQALNQVMQMLSMAMQIPNPTDPWQSLWGGR